MATAATHTR